MPTQLCKLCRHTVADKRNSHIVPKFLCKSLFDTTPARHTVSIDRSGKGQKRQDTPKENHILCASCEKRIEIIETYFAPIFRDVYAYATQPSQFHLSTLGTQQYIECESINPSLFKLFIYSIVWRMSVSTLFEYQKFKLAQKAEEELRAFLFANLQLTKGGLIRSVDNIKDVPQFHSCLIMPVEKSERSRGIFTNCNLSETSHLLLLVDFGLFFYTDDVSIGDVLRKFSNKQNKKVIVALADLKGWKDLSQLVMAKMLRHKANS